MKLLLRILSQTLVLLISFNAVAQVNQDQFVNYQTMNNVNVGNTVHLSTPFRGGVEGTKYMFDEWKEARCIFFRNNLKFKTEKLNYNVADGLFEVEVDDQIRGINGEYVLSFEVDESRESTRSFTSCKAKEFRSLSLTGFMETIYSGEDITLYEHAYVYIRPATYNTALMEGATKEKIYIKGEYYLKRDGEVSKIEKKKDLNGLVGDKKKLKGLKFKRQELIDFFADNQL
ncbi:MAG: hypothetical protein HRT61_19770 [Ekhidna sp.]|nr:hypothetical protein [Ekhidna sp.]